MPLRSLNIDALLRAANDWRARALFAAGLVFYLVHHLTRFRLATVWPPAPRMDMEIVFDFTNSIFASGVYPEEIFPYSPSAVFLFRVLTFAGPAASAIAWYLLIGAGIVISIRAALSQERAELRAAWPLIGAVAIFLADSPIRWDLRNCNNNLIYLGLVMAGYGLAARRPIAGGALVAMSVSLKLYSGLLIAWLLVNGPRRAFYAGAIVVALLWIVVPIAWFGVPGAIELYSGWLKQVSRIADVGHHELIAKSTGSPLVTLHRAVVHLTGGTYQSAQYLVRALQAVWIAALLWYAWRCRNCLLTAMPSRAALADWTVLLLAPLPLSPWLEPYHAVPMLIAAVLVTTLVLDRQLERRDRLAAAVAMAVLLIFLLVRVPFSVRGLGLLAQFMALVGVLGWLRPRLARAPAT